jgi:hypothetical protein
MKFTFHVHRVSAIKITTDADVKGVKLPVEVSGLEVELTSDIGSGFAFRVTHPSEIAEAKKIFQHGKTLTVDIV